MYKIVRFYYGQAKSRIIKSGLTMEQAQAHCNDQENRKEGVFFDGYMEVA
jgi:hypothetical protein